ncbi:uncharacterized protein LOC118734999 [Rhagoletis pomonella]|uniref:uncharacterized protein LOC118734999 n=1 Tax=Rhagoletis pomonella TaxID=28610 RepID=UPI001780ADAC|nr:uncharacterized protein LOC118734999 [Rhagoletis pomonella]
MQANASPSLTPSDTRRKGSSGSGLTTTNATNGCQSAHRTGSSNPGVEPHANCTCTGTTGPACLSDLRLLKESIPAQLYSSTHPCVNAQEKHPYLEFYFRTSNAGYKCATRISNVPSFQHLPDFRRHRSSIPSNINVGASNYQSNRSYIEHPVSNIITSEYPRSWER